MCWFFFFFKQKTAYEMRISDWSSDVCSSDLEKDHHTITGAPQVYDGKLIVPVSSKEVLSALFELRPCCSSHGLLQALDPYTGATLWTYDATAAARLQLSTGKLAPNGVSQIGRAHV